MRGRLSLLGVLLAFVLLAPTTSGQPPSSVPTLRAHFIDVGQGAATLVEFPCAAVLIDTGGEENGDFNSTVALMDYLDTFFNGRVDLNKTLHSIILTHPHVDHTRGVSDVVAKYRVLNAVTNGQETGSGKYGQIALHKKVADAEATPGTEPVGFTAVHVNDIPQGKGLTNDVIDPVKCQDVDPKITALWGTLTSKPSGWTNSAFNEMNNHSVAVRIDFGKASLLVPGDLEETAIPTFIAHYANTTMLDVDVYQVGHHGSHNGTTHALLNAMTPQIAVISMGPASRQTTWTAWAYGHPRQTTIDMLLGHVSQTRPKKTVQVATGVRTFKPVTIEKAIYGTGWDGAVVLEADTNGTWKALGSTVPPVLPGLVNINTATVDELTTLPMIGRTRARAIVQDRDTRGPFQRVDDLTRVPGIGPATLNAIRNLVTTGS